MSATWERSYKEAFGVVKFATSHDLDIEELSGLVLKLRALRDKLGEEQFAEFLALLGLVTKECAADAGAVEDVRRKLWKHVDTLELSVRAANSITNAGITHVYEIVLKTEADWLKTKNCGRKTLREIRELLQKLFGFPTHVQPFGIRVNPPQPEREVLVVALAEKIVAMRKAA